jgi:hypothetical protein
MDWVKRETVVSRLMKAIHAGMPRPKSEVQWLAAIRAHQHGMHMTSAEQEEAMYEAQRRLQVFDLKEDGL